jgi:hypothetical protein
MAILGQLYMPRSFFNKLNVAILGMSADSVNALAGFCRRPCQGPRRRSAETHRKAVA